MHAFKNSIVQYSINIYTYIHIYIYIYKQIKEKKKVISINAIA